jgi:hypothetical protein
MQRPPQQLNGQNAQLPQRQNPPQAFRLVAQSSQNALNQLSQALGPCFKCGMSDHFARQCPNSQPALGSGSQ